MRASSGAKGKQEELTRTDPYYVCNRPHICSPFAKGGCNQGVSVLSGEYTLPAEGCANHGHREPRQAQVSQLVALPVSV